MNILAHNLVFAEGLRWREGRYWFSDMHGGRIHSVGIDGDLETIARVPGQPSGLGWTPDGKLLVVSMSGQRILRLEGRKLTLHADLSSVADRDCNDMLVDDRGYAYVGCLGFDFWGGESPRPTRLLMVDPDGRVSVAAKDLMCPNGMALLHGGRTLVVAESFGERITAFDRAADGRLSNRRIFAEMKDGVPDGIGRASDQEIWVADPRRRQVLKVGPNGQVVRHLEIDEGRMPVDCEIGGDDGELLAICTSPWRHDASTSDRASRIEVVACKASPRLVGN